MLLSPGIHWCDWCGLFWWTSGVTGWAQDSGVLHQIWLQGNFNKVLCVCMRSQHSVSTLVTLSHMCLWPREYCFVCYSSPRSSNTKHSRVDVYASVPQWQMGILGNGMLLPAVKGHVWGRIWQFPIEVALWDTWAHSLISSSPCLVSTLYICF